MSSPALIDKFMQAGKWLLKPDLVPVDDVTIKRGSTAISVAISALVRSGGGLAVDAKTGRLYVDFSLVPDDQMQAIVLAMVQQGGGLAVDGTGKLYVDFASMPTDKFESMLKSIRVPLWLSKPLNIYVAPTGSDTLDDGRGLSPDKPFLTVAAAVRYVSTTYNLYIYNAYIRVSPGIYDLLWLDLPGYSTSTGVIVITGDEDKAGSTIIGGIRNNLGGVYYIRNCTVRPSNTVTGNSVYAIQCTLGQLQLSNANVDFTDVIGKNFAALYTSQAGTILVPAMSNGTPEGVSVNAPAEMFVYLYITGGTFSFSADLTVHGDTALYGNYGFCYATNGGSVLRKASGAGATNPSRLPLVNVSGTVAGNRYGATANGIINTAGAGPDFFPGTAPGTTSYGGQYV